jgi:TIR domain-containing protein
MKIFLSYSSKDRASAEEISLALTASGHDVFFDRVLLKPGDGYNRRLSEAIDQADAFVFLITPDSIRSGTYSLSELKFAREKWPRPENRVLPVMLKPTALEAIPPYLKAITILEPEGNVAAEVVHALRGRKPPGTNDESRKVRVGVHLGYFESNPAVPVYFINITNLSEERDVEVTHVWFESVPQVFPMWNDRLLPVRLRPDESWETWTRMDELPPVIRENPFELARVRLSTGQVVTSVKNANVPERGRVPGGSITSPWME